MFPSHHLPHIHRKIFFFLVGTAFTNVFFNREANCSLLEVSTQRWIFNKSHKFHKTQVFTVQLLSFLLYYCPVYCSQYPQLLASKLSGVYAVSPEQHHGTEQVEKQPEGKVAMNTAKVWVCHSVMKLDESKARLPSSSPGAGCKSVSIAVIILSELCAHSVADGVS